MKILKRLIRYLFQILPDIQTDQPRRFRKYTQRSCSRGRGGSGSIPIYGQGQTKNFGSHRSFGGHR